MGFALFQAQRGGKHLEAKPLNGFRGAGVLEIVEDFDGSTFRAVYTVRISDAVYVLHAFQKRSKKGIETPRREMNWCDSGCGWRGTRIGRERTETKARTNERRHA
jgi:phage-related protein